MQLTAIEVNRAKPRAKTYRMNDGHGLYLVVYPTGRKTWRYRYETRTADGKRREGLYTIGEHIASAPYGESEDEARIRIESGRVTLAEARIERERAYKLHRAGQTPTLQRDAARAARKYQESQTVERLVLEWIARQPFRPNSERHYRSVWRVAGAKIFGAWPITEVTSPMVLEGLQAAAKKAPMGTVLSLRKLLHCAFRSAVESFQVASNPVLLWREYFPRPETKYRRALTMEETGRMLRDAAAVGRMPYALLALRLVMWTLCRVNEVTGARWSEIDLDTATWRIPAARMKAGREHVLWLPRQAVEALRAHKKDAVSDYVFPALLHSGRAKKCPESAPMTDQNVRRLISLAGWDGRFSPHAARTTGRTILGEMGYAHDVMEMQLAHAVGSAVERAYNHAQRRAARLQMMQDWADMLDDLESGDPALLAKWQQQRRPVSAAPDDGGAIRLPDDPVRRAKLLEAVAQIDRASYEELQRLFPGHDDAAPAPEIPAAPAPGKSAVVIKFPGGKRAS